MDNQYQITQKLNEYKEFKRKMLLMSESLTNSLDHLNVCMNKLSSCYYGYGDGIGILKLQNNLQESKSFIMDRVIPEIDLEIKNLTEQLSRE